MSSKLITSLNDECEKQKEISQIFSKCGSFGSITMNEGTTTASTISVVTINTSCLCNPSIKLEFTSNIIIPETVASVSINFQVFALCNNQFQPIPIGPIWNFSESAEVASADTFKFFLCHCDSCFNDCCTYTVVVDGTVTSVVEEIGSVTINNAMLSAIVVEATN